MAESRDLRPLSDPVGKVAAALQFVSSTDRQTWINVGMAIKDGLGEAGFDLWNTWSANADNYDEKAALSTWKSFKSGGRTLASLYYEAKKHGFKPADYKIGDTPEIAPIDTAVAEKKARQAKKDQEARQKRSARKAEAVLKAAAPGEKLHPYLSKKWLPLRIPELPADKLEGIIGYAPESKDGLLQGRILVIPVGDEKGLTGVEMIDEHGRKSLLANTRKAGCWYAASKLQERAVPPAKIFIAEGVATAHSIHKACPDAGVVAAFTDNNLKNVALNLRRQFPDASLVIAGDRGSEAKTIEAARAASCGYVLPKFMTKPDGQPVTFGGKAPTDFNDMMVMGLLSKEGQSIYRSMADVLNDTQHPEIDASGVDTPVLTDSTVGSPTKPDRSNNTMNKPTKKEAAPAAEENSQEPEAVTKRTRQAGAPLMKLTDIPLEVRDVARAEFGQRIEMYPPRENGGPYNGRVYNTDAYLIQEVAPRSVVIHDKSQLTWINDRLASMNDNKKLNNVELMVVYDKEKPTVYPYDRQRDALDRAVKSLKKSAKELDMNLDEVGPLLDKLQEKSFGRVQDMRKAEREKIKARKTDEKPEQGKPKR